VFPSPGLPRRQVLDRLLAGVTQPVSVQIETSCLQTIAAMVESGDRLTILGRSQVADGMGAGLAALSAIKVPHTPRVVGITTRADWLPTPVQSLYLSAVRDAVGMRGP
jgi:DNA-binding transcriptional LysR family regulator